MKKLKTFEEHNNPYLHQPNVDNTTFPPPGPEDDDEDEMTDESIMCFTEMGKEIKLILDKYKEKYPRVCDMDDSNILDMARAYFD